jgi:hypothetical protein
MTINSIRGCSHAQQNLASEYMHCDLNSQKDLRMSSVTLQFRGARNEAGLIFTAVAALLLGTAVYLLDRDWASTLVLSSFVAYQWPRSAVFGAFGGFLPALLHAYAISVLIIVALRPWPWTRPWVCLLWFTIASALEWLQSDAAETLFFTTDRLPGDMALLGYLERYTLQGQFDKVDLLATGVGCLTALAVTISSTPHRQRTLA